MPGKRDRFAWLWRNKFYQQTPLLGYGFIELARTKKAAIFWYLVVIIITTVAIVNTRLLYVEYLSNPTYMVYIPVTSSENLFVPNITVQLELPLFDLTTDPVINKAWAYSDEAETSSFIEHLICFIMRGNGKYPDGMSMTVISSNDVTHQHIFSLDHDYLHPYVRAADERIVPDGPLSGKHNLERWNEMQQPLHEEFLQLLLKNRDEPRSLFYDMWEQMDELLSSVVRARPADAYVQLSILKYLTEVGNKTISYSFKRTPAQVYAAAIDALNHIFHIKVKNRPEAQFSLTNWNYYTGRVTDHAEWLKIGFTVDVKLPTGLKVVDIEIHSYFYNYQQQLWRAISQFQQIVAHKYSCDDDYINYVLEDQRSVMEHGYSEQKAFTKFYFDHIEAQTHTFGNHFIDLIPRTTFTSQLGSCIEKTSESCVKECGVEVHSDLCDCIPWNLYGSNRKLPICTQACTVPEDELESCLSNCDADVGCPCLLNTFDVQAHDSHQVNSNEFARMLPLHTVHISILKNMTHLRSIEVKQLTLTTLIAHLGQILAFWIGFNMLALIHLTIFIFKQIGNATSILCNNSDRRQDSKAKDGELHLKSLQDELDDEMHGIHRKIAYYSWQRSGYKGRKLESFFENEFYDQSPIVAFNLIGAAQTIIEKCFWWLAMIVFSGITIWSCQRPISSFFTSPTQTSVRPTILTQDFMLKNMTLQIGLPLIELFNFHFLIDSIEHRMRTATEGTVSDVIACCTTKYWYDPYLTDLMTDGISDKWVRVMEEQQWDMLNTRKRSNFNMDQADNNGVKLNQWKKLFNTAKWKLLDVLKSNKDKPIPMPKKNNERLELASEFNNLMNEVMERRDNHTYMKLMMLESMKTGLDPRDKISSLTNARKGQLKPNQLLLGSDSRSLLIDTLIDLQDIINIRIRNTEGAGRAFLVDWTYLNGRTSLDMPDYGQVFTFDIELPRNLRHVTIEISSYSAMWHVYIVETVMEYFSWLKVNHPEFFYKFECRAFEPDDLHDALRYVEETNVQHEMYDMYMDYGYVLTEMQTGASPVVSTPIPVAAAYSAQTQHTFNSSNIQGCNDLTPKECIRKCVMNLHLEMCTCVPLKYYAYAEPDQKLCDRPCLGTNSTDCAEKCGHPYCHLQPYNLRLKEAKENHGLAPLAVIEIDTDSEHLHQQYRTVYAISKSQVLYTILGHLELWLGLNIVAIIHVFVFTCSKFCRSSKKQHNHTKTTWNGIEEMKNEMEQKFSAKITELKSHNKSSESSRFAYQLRYNTFFLETPLKGYGFIPQAKKIIEVAVWYLAIITFTVLMVYNVQSVFKTFMSHSTRWTILPVIVTDKTHMENMTLTLNLPFVDFTTTNLMNSRLDAAFESAKTWQEPDWWLPKFLACHITDTRFAAGDPEDYYTEERFKWLADHWTRILEGTWQGHTIQTNSDYEFSSKAKLKEWKNKLSEGANDMLDFLISNHNATVFSINEPSEGKKMKNTIKQLFDAPLNWRNEWLDFQLMILHALESGGDPLQQLNSILEDWVKVEGQISTKGAIPDVSHLPPHPSKSQMAKQYLQKFGVTTSDLFHSIQSDLSKVLHVNVANIAGAKARLRNWNYTATAVHSDVQQITLDLLLPANVSRLTIEIRSFVRMWQRHLLEAFGRYFDHLIDHDPDSKKQKCFRLPLRPNLIEMEKRFADDGIFEKDVTSVQLGIPVGASLNIHTRRTVVRLSQVFQVISNTQGCDTEHRVCLDTCESEESIKSCECIPWTMIYTDEQSDVQVCDQPCNVDEKELYKCRDMCAQKVEHPCKLNVYSMREESDFMSASVEDPLDNPIFIINIKHKGIYPKFLEERSMQFSGFLSQLGGILAFWIGANLTAFMQLFVFFIRKMAKKYRSGKTNGNGGSVFADKIAQPVSEIDSFEKKMNSDMRHLEKEMNKMRKHITPNGDQKVTKNKHHHHSQGNEQGKNSDRQSHSQAKNKSGSTKHQDHEPESKNGSPKHQSLKIHPNERPQSKQSNRSGRSRSGHHRDEASRTGSTEHRSDQTVKHNSDRRHSENRRSRSRSRNRQ